MEITPDFLAGFPERAITARVALTIIGIDKMIRAASHLEKNEIVRSFHNFVFLWPGCPGRVLLYGTAFDFKTANYAVIRKVAHPVVIS